MVLARSSVSICTTLACSVVLMALDEDGMVGPIEVGGTQRHNSLSSTMVTVVAASSLLFCSQSSAH
jgi:hypothetical protein